MRFKIAGTPLRPQGLFVGAMIVGQADDLGRAVDIDHDNSPKFVG